MRSSSCNVADQDPISAADQTFTRNVGAQETRKLNAGLVRSPVWQGLGMLGLIGWSVCLPTLLGAWLGHWLDGHHPGTHAWTLALLVGGLCLGCANAAHWVSREQRAIRRGLEDPG
jgi:ATP synthase protein I